jgi:all-trans-retinol 13,14-reductase
MEGKTGGGQGKKRSAPFLVLFLIVCYRFFMANEWDTIIIGAGIGGLTAAAHLVKAGLRVLVLERNSHPGGTAYEYHRKSFTFPMGPLGFSSPGLIQNTLTNLGVGDNLDFSRVHYRVRAFGLDIPVSLPFPDLVTKLSVFFPSDARGIDRFFEEMKNRVSDPLAPGKVPDISASEYLHRRIRDPRLRRILGSIGTREPYSSLSLLAAMWNLMCRQGIWYPREGMQEFCERWTKAVTPSGEIRLGKEVAGIRVEQGKAAGVTLGNGTEIGSGSVISNADYKNTFLKLVDPGSLSPNWHRAVSEAHQTGSIIQICLGVDTAKVDLSTFEEASRLIYRRAMDDSSERELNWGLEEIDPDVLASQEIEVSLWGKNDRTIAPTGEAVIVIRTEAEHSHFKRFRSPKKQRFPEYQGYKNRLGQSLIREIEHLLPGLGEAILVMDVATPLTFEDQGGRSGGAVAGWSWDYEDFRDDQPRELIRTPVRGLYMAGYQAFSALFMGGVPTAMESGKRAAKAVLEEAGPTEEIPIPLSRSQKRGEG